ncbi:amidohydrolase family protein [Brevundimonas vesicularis]|uniref:amidohydrolase family protein n=1 Tax=Brevundimonas vesicularis TaxID=41276 RepID=UPI0038D3EC13
MRIKSLLAGAVAALALSGPALAQDIAITNGRILTGTSVIEKGTVVIRGGKVVSVGTGAAPAGLKVVDATGKVVTPGLVAVDAGLGGSEISSVTGSNDLGNAANSLTAAFDVSYGLDPWSFALPVARLGGITRAVVMPRHAGSGSGHAHDDSDFAGAGHGGFQTPGLFAGQAAVIKLNSGTDILVKPRVAMVAPFGEAGARVAGGARGAEFVLFKETLAEVRLYARNKAAYERAGLRGLSLSRADLEALIPVANGTMPLVVTVRRASDILQVLRLAQEEGVKVILDSAEEGWMVADQIAAARVPVLVNALANLPASLEMRGARMQNAAALHAAGVVIAIKGSDGTGRIREMRYNAGNAVSHGLPFDAALAAITVNPARIFGFEGQFGELKAGAAGDVVVWSGDPLEPLSQPSAVVVDGVEQPLQSRTLMLRDRYRTGGEGAMPPAYPQ